MDVAILGGDGKQWWKESESWSVVAEVLSSQDKGVKHVAQEPQQAHWRVQFGPL